MEIRKLQLTGGSSLAVTLPKKWADNFGLKDKDAVIIYAQKSGSLIVEPARLKEKLFKTVLNIGDMTNEMLEREMIAHYISGSDEVMITSQKITQEERNAIRKASQSLLGYEIIEESLERIIIKNIFDAVKFPVVQNIEKMFAVAKSMFYDAIKAITQNNDSLARDVIDRDFEIDKLQLAIKRQFYTLIQGRVYDEEIGLSQKDMSYCDNVATQLERIADHAAKTARAVINADKKSTSPISSGLKSLFNKILPLLESSEEMIKKLDKSMAHKILDKNSAIEKSIFLNRNAKSLKEMIAVDSLDRLRGYVMNLAEITIDQTIAKQEWQNYALENETSKRIY